MEESTKKNYSYVRRIRHNNECLFKNIVTECSTKGKHKTEKNHLIQKSLYLKRISHKDKVMVFDFENRDYIKNEGKLVIRNIKNANTFHVLCGNHDRILFDEIENGNKFDENNQKQLFQFALRAFIFFFSSTELKSKFDSIASEGAKRVANAHLNMNQQRLELYKKAVSEQKWDSVETKIIRINSKIEFITCYAGAPNLGFVLPVRFTSSLISLNIFPDKDDAIILLSYLKDDASANAASKFCRKLVKLSKKSRKKFLDYVSKFVIAFDHNIAINPIYWENLNDKEKENFYELAHIFPKCKTIKEGLIGFIKLKYKKSIFNLFSE